MSDRAKSVIAAVVIAVVFFVLVLPLAEMDATARRRTVVIALPPAAITFVSPLLLMATCEMEHSRKVKDRPELLTILCVLNC